MAHTSDSDGAYEVDHHLSDADRNVHSAWDNSLDPALVVEPGDVVRFECRDAVDGQIGVETTAEDVMDVSFDPVHPLTGPVAVEGVEPGDVLEVELLDLQHKGWGFTNFFPGEMGLGLLPDEFDEPDIHVWDLRGDAGRFVNGSRCRSTRSRASSATRPPPTANTTRSRRAPSGGTWTSNT